MRVVIRKPRVKAQIAPEIQTAVRENPGAGVQSEEPLMRLKSYFAPSVEAALAEGRQELGPDAMIVQSRRAPPESQYLGAYEVVLALTGEAAVERATRRAPQRAESPKAPPVTASAPQLAHEFSELRRQMEEMRRSLSRSVAARPLWLAPSSDAAEVFAVLLEAEVEPGLAQQVVENAAASVSRLRPSGNTAEGALGRAVAEEIQRRFSVDPHLGPPVGAEAPVVALVGPPGAGKTTALIKLAVTQGLAARRPVVLFSADTCRIAAADQLRSYAALLGVGFELVESISVLDRALRLHGGKELILIDTPGFGAADMEEAAALAQFLCAHPEIDTHLVLMASLKSADLTRAVERFEIFRPAKLLVTRLDETGSLGAVVSEAARTSKPLSFLSTGQQIPEDLEPATKQRVMDLVMPLSIREALAAA